MPISYRVTAACAPVRRYGETVRKGLASCVSVCVVACLGGCSTGSSGDGQKTAPKESPCPLVARLDATAAKVARADVSDPGAFKQTLAAAVDRYVATVRALKRVTPDDLRADLDRMEAAVHQYRFEDAASARASLDAFAAGACGSTVPGVNAGASFGSNTVAPTTTLGS
jgi:hypothetical protein